MKRTWMLGSALLSLVLAAATASAGANAGATARLSWGPGLGDSLTSLAIPAGVDTQLVFYVSITGLRELRGIDIQLPILGGGEGSKPTALPPAWQFQPGAPCDNEDNVSVSARFPGCAVSGMQALVTALNGIYQGTPERFQAFSGMTFVSLACAAAHSIAREPAQRYGLVKVTMEVHGSKCPGAENPVCIRPALRLGSEKDRGAVLGIVDQSLQYDYIPFERGYDRLTINAGKGGCPSPSPAAASVWGRSKSVKH